MKIKKLNDVSVRAAKPAAKGYSIGDGSGLCLYVAPTGGKLWRWSYEYNCQEKLMSFGRYPAISLAAARKLHNAGRELLVSGRDPMVERKRIKSGGDDPNTPKKTTFGEVLALWFAHWGTAKDERYVNTVKNRLDKDVLPEIGCKAIEDIDTVQIVTLIKKIQDRGSVDIAKRALQKIKQIYRYAVANGHVKLSPAAQIIPSDILVTVPVQNFARVDSTELPQLLKDIEVYCGNPLTRLAMKLMAHTFTRTTEMILAEWNEFDFESRRWTIPKAHRKGKKTPLIVPLAEQTIQILELIRQISGKSRWVFPGSGYKTPNMSNGTIDAALDRMGYQGLMTGHGFRGVASTILHEAGYVHEHIETQLSHSKRDKVSGAYDYAKYLAPRAAMMQDWADFLDLTLRSGRYSLTHFPENKLGISKVA